MGRGRLEVAVCGLAGTFVLAATISEAGGAAFKSWPATYRWHTFYGSSAPDGGGAIAVDRSGRVASIGYSYSAWTGPAGQAPLHAYTAVGSNAVIVQTDANGAYLWHTFYPGALNGISEDSAGNIYVTGNSHASWLGPAGQPPLHPHPGGAGAIVVMKLDASGAYRWHTFYGSGHPNYGNNGAGVAADAWGNLSVTGDSAGGSWTGSAGQAPLNPFSGLQDAFVLRLDGNGAYQWHAFYGSGNDGGKAVAADSWGVEVVGYSGAAWNGPAGKAPLNPYRSSGPYTSDIFVLKLNTNGTYAWHAFYGSGADTGFAITPVGAAGFGIYIAGRSGAAWNGPSGQAPLNAYHGDAVNTNDVLVLKLSRDGAYQWHTFYGSGLDTGYGVATDLDTVYVAADSGASWAGPAGQQPAHPISPGGSIALLTLGTDGAYRSHTFLGGATSGTRLAVSSGALHVGGSGYSGWDGPAGEPPVHAAAGSGDFVVMKVVPEIPSLVLSDEGSGLIGRLVAAGYGGYNLYDCLVAIQADTAPSVADLVTPEYLAALQRCPANSPIFTSALEDIAAGSSVVVSSDCTWRLVDVRGEAYYSQPGISTLRAAVSGVGTAQFTYTTATEAPLLSFDVGGMTYNVFAIAWAPKRGSLRRVIPVHGGS